MAKPNTDSMTFTFRPWVEHEGDYIAVRDWCIANEVSFGALINSLLPALSYSLTNKHTSIPGKRFVSNVGWINITRNYINADWGDMEIIQHKTPTL